MKYAANELFVFVSLAMVFCSSGSNSNADICRCATPPGGDIQCPPGHTGFCWIDNGQVHGGCEPTPKGLKGDELKAWVLSKALGRRIAASDVRATISLDEAFMAGRYSDPNSGKVVTFRVPTDGNQFALDRHLGTWNLNGGRSALGGRTPQKSTVTYTPEGSQIKITTDAVETDGKPVHSTWKGKFDGRDYPVIGDPNSDVRSYTPIDDRTIEFAGKKDGQVTVTGKIDLAPDGKSRTVTTIGNNPVGKKIRSTAVYEKSR